MLKRKIEKYLEKWKEKSDKKALCIVGARQIGKTTVARHFGKKHYKQVIEINFIENPEAHDIFMHDLTAENLVLNLTAYLRKPIFPGETLLILDEIQECPQARTAIKFLVQDARMDIIETGSLLGVKEKDVVSFPVGFEERIQMYPLDFEEFLWAMQLPEATFTLLKECYKTKNAPTQAVHNVMMRLFYSYLVVGGMPEVVQKYVDSQDIAQVVSIQEAILDLYRQDISKYAKYNEKLRIKDIFDSIPAQLDSKNNRFKLSYIDKNARMNRYENSFLWLQEAGVALACYNTKTPCYPLILNEKRNLFRLYLNDTGLLCAAIGNVQYDLLQGNTELNSGSILENMFGQALASKNLNLYYYDSKSKNIELDFVVEQNRKIDILEIKSGKDYKKHRALDKALEEDWDIHQAIVFSKYPLEKTDRILYLPFYMILFYADQGEDKPMIWKVDLSDLYKEES
jgi:hypothetical protein